MLRLTVLAAAVCVFSTAAFSSPVSGTANIGKREYSGQATWFDVGLGACGITNTNDQLVVALSSLIYDGGEYCFTNIQITNTANGVTQTGEVVDKCPGCGEYDIDLSPSLFEALGADLSQGVIQVEWEFV